MRFPDTLTITVRNDISALPVKDVAIIVVLFATRKNNYHVGPLITNEEGLVSLTREDCHTAIKNAQEMFAMDYSGDLESCRRFIEVLLHPPDQIATMLEQYATSPGFWGKAFTNPTRMFADLQKVKNTDHEPARIRATEEQLVADPHLDLLLVKRVKSG